MCNLLDDLISSLDKLNWDSAFETHKIVNHLLESLNQSRVSFKSSLVSLPSSKLEIIASNSVETSTYFKWGLHKDEHRRYVIWLHEYKSATRRQAGYANTAHNHRYWFTSLILCGGFTHISYDVKRSKSDNEQVQRIFETRRVFFPIGTIYTVNPEDIHSLDELVDPTLTLIVQSKAIKAYSEAFSLTDNKITLHHSFEARTQKFSEIVDLIDED
jgi:predicted metal-dependent enzyme (double-stranded beta helix superfamily)